MNNEKRRSPRKPLEYPAQVDMGDGSAPRVCALADVSTTGARVIVQAGDEMPNEIMLLLGQQGSRRRCRVAWRDGDEIGLEFVKDLAPERQAPPRRSARRKA